MAAEGIPLVAISAQNEPNYTATWDTCRYTPAQMVTFVRDFLGPALAAANQNVPVMAPETRAGTASSSFANALMADLGRDGHAGTAGDALLRRCARHYDVLAKAAGKVLEDKDLAFSREVNKETEYDDGLAFASRR